MSTLIFAALAGLVLAGIGFLYGRSRTRAFHIAETQTVRGELSALQQLTTTLAGTLALDDIVGEIAAFVRGFLQADGVLVALAPEESGSILISAADGSVSALAGSEHSREDSGLLGQALKENRVAVSHAEEGFRPELVTGFTVNIAAVAPLETHGMARGVLAAVRDGAEAFTADDIMQLVTVATHTSIALAHASLVEMLKRGKEQWEATFDVLSAGIAVVDGQCRIRRANRTFAGISEQPVTDLVGLDLCEQLPGDATQVGQYLDSVRNGDDPPAFTYHSMSPEKRFLISASRMPGAKAVWLAVQVEDVTERKAMEEQLIQSEKMATVGQLVSGVAHDLNNPITSIAGVADLLAGRPSDSSESLEHIDMIRQEADRAAHIVRNLLTFSRKDRTEWGDVNLNEVAKRSAALVGYDMKLGAVKFQLMLDQNLPLIRGDKHELQQVVLNLLQNAVQAVVENADASERQVSLGTACKDESVTLRVTDNGPGIDETLLPQIFLPFITTKPKGQGTGLGLSIAYRIIQAHNGSIDARPQNGGGTTFQVTLPLRGPNPEERTQEEGPQQTKSENEPKRPTGSLSILVLDEDPAVQRSLRLSFSEDGHTVDATRDASQAFSLLQKNDYDLIIADAEATNDVGSTFGESLKGNRPDLCPKTILLTTDVSPESDERLGALGCRYLRKPFETAELRSAAAEIAP